MQTLKTRKKNDGNLKIGYWILDGEKFPDIHQLSDQLKDLLGNLSPSSDEDTSFLNISTKYVDLFCAERLKENIMFEISSDSISLLKKFEFSLHVSIYSSGE